MTGEIQAERELEGGLASNRCLRIDARTAQTS